MTTVVLAIVLLTGWWRLLGAQTVLFAMCAFISLKLNPWGHVYRFAIQPRITPTTEREEAAPLRFAQGVGFVFALLGTVGYAAGYPTFGTVATGLALVAAFLNAAFGLCLGCEMYLLLRRYAPALARPQ
ncbi:DUF4395 domain-containing protein [Nocardia sp. NRRL S-836]|uniref:DUF4395 domain-containing protein n=1 Tax=Nocardia sp. NRRL S-836 TaxID=1519492 RepID=UPI0006AD99A1|nr:membrane protein [Nocardia sp. NRRL S-836]